MTACMVQTWRAPLLIVMPWVVTAGAAATGDTPEAAAVRHAALEAGLRSLASVAVPQPHNLGHFLKPGQAARRAATVLGKALFWDMQVGSDGQACASCHFHAGADNRFKNQLNPGSRNVDPALRKVFDATGSGSTGGPNYALREGDFPFHLLEDPEEENLLDRVVLFDSDDIASSQGVFSALFAGVVPGLPADLGIPIADGVFQVGGTNVRRVEPRNTPTVINAVFNFSNFCDGRAHNVFNGGSVLGPLDDEAYVYVRLVSGCLVQRQVHITNCSLGSQAVGPPTSDLEMSFFDRPFPEVARKLLDLRPLGLQLVHPEDSVLGPYSRAELIGGVVTGQPGLNTSYKALIKQAFRFRYWGSSHTVGG